MRTSCPSFCMSHLSAEEIVLPSINSHKNYYVWHFITRQRRNRYVRNLVRALCHWRLLLTRAFWVDKIRNINVTDTWTSEVGRLSCDDLILYHGVIYQWKNVTPVGCGEIFLTFSYKFTKRNQKLQTTIRLKWRKWSQRVRSTDLETYTTHTGTTFT